MKKISIGLALSALVFVLPATAGDVAKGKTIAETVCMACHNPATGEGNMDIYPNLGGQKETYLVSSIKAYKDGQRTGPMAGIMKGMVANLSDEDIANVSAYFASLK
ncbi:cytochrome c biogenesis protein CcsB [Neiella marina]|uniref:Cytochrome c biogenesis protein CcsB n=1 Tax=Neiella marina TaxID=508461 RepID=A0A8J2XNU8_9GAMM|nr:cytochrome c [Neiella marina]GGA75022.1 cytochrome c biogenesis protein CcsB [Neiella marina]